MPPRPARRMRFLAAASSLTAALLLAFSGSATAHADTSRHLPGILGLMTSYLQPLEDELQTLEATVSGFADSFTTKNLTFTAGTGDTLTVNQLCVTKSDGTPVCVTGDQLAAVLDNSAGGGSPSSNTSAAFTTTPPVIQINGDNPAIVQVGDTYSDPGATITGPQADLNLGIATYVNGAQMNPVQIDTSEVATDTIDYVASDQNGLASTSTRTVIIEAAADSIIGSSTASSTEATSTAQ